MNQKMKKMSFAMLAGASALAVNQQASKAALTIVAVDEGVSTINGASYDLVNFYLTAATGLDATAGVLSSTGGILGLSGTFTDSVVNGIAVPGSAATYPSYIIQGGDASLPSGFDSSLVELDSQTTPSRSGTGTTTTSKGKVTAVTGVSTSFGSTWFTTDNAIIASSDTTGNAAVQNQVAQIYITPGSQVTFTGNYVTYGVNGGAITFASPGATSSTSSTTTSTAQKIISLTNTAPTTYGSQLGHAITITGANGAYTVGDTGANASTGATTAFTATSTFNPITDKEVYALKLDQNGVAIATTNTTLIAAIIQDINASSTGVTASTVSAPYSSLFPGYDILLTSTAGFSAAANGTAYLGVDFSQDTTDTGVTVTEIAAVPEPATAAGLVLGASGLLLGRRKNRATVA